MKRQFVCTSLSAIAVAFLGSACEKDEGDKSKNSPAEMGGGGPGASRPVKRNTKGNTRPVVTPGSSIPAPTAADLPTYTEGLSGEGTLMTRISTNHGVIHCELFEAGAPMTVANFVGLARGLHSFKDPQTQKIEKRPFFDGLIFHRVIPGFMIQGGDPLGRGSGGPGYKFDQEVSTDLKHDRPGILSMANAGAGTNGSQFFITEGKRPSLDGGYNVFGECMEIDVVGKIARVAKQGSKPRDPVVMEKVEIFRDDIKKYPKKKFSQ